MMTTATRVKILLLATLPPLVAAAASAVAMLLTPDLPERLAVHWGFDGTVDRTDTLGSSVVLVPVLVCLFTAGVAGFTMASLRGGTSRVLIRTAVGLSTGFGVFISLGIYLTVFVQRGVDDVESLPGSAVALPLVIGFAAALVSGAGAALLVPDVPPAPRPTQGKRMQLELGKGEQAYWSSVARSPRGVVAIPIVAIVVVAILFWVVGLPIWLTVLFTLLLASLLTMLAWRVVVDRRGLTVTGLFGFPRFRTPVEDVVSATVIHVNAIAEFGGWGVRIGRSGAWGVVTHSGEAIEVERRKGAPFVVTVDDAATGAGLLTSLAGRQKS